MFLSLPLESLEISVKLIIVLEFEKIHLIGLTFIKLFSRISFSIAFIF